MNALFAQLLKPFAPMQQDQIEPDELTDAPKRKNGRWDTKICKCCNAPDGEPHDPVCIHAQKPNIAPHIAKIPLRAEVRDMLIAAKLYDEQADASRNQAEALLKRADYLEQLARDGRQVADNLTRMANL